MRHPFRILVACGALMVLSPAMADSPAAITVTIKNHVFTPSEIKIPAGKAVELKVMNQDPTAEEFESNSLKIEKIIPGNSAATIRLKPQAAGTHKFVGEFHEATAHGTIVVE